MKYSMVNLAGLMIGAVSTFFVYPHALVAYGLFQVLQSVGMIGMPLLTFGANTVAIRFFPRFQDKPSGHHGFVVVLALLCGVGILVSTTVVSIFWDEILHFMQTRAKDGADALLPTYFWLALPLAFFYSIGLVLSVYSSNFKRIVIPSLLLDFSQKIIAPLLLIAVWQQWISLETALYGLVAHSMLVMFSLVFYLRWLKEWHWDPQPAFFTPALRKELLQFILFGGRRRRLEAVIFLIKTCRPTKRAPDAGDSAAISSSFLRLIIFLAGRLRRPRPSAGNANRWAFPV